jgi:ureidoglycolate lyase
VSVTLKPEVLTRERFAPFGDVIEAVSDHKAGMNSGRFDRFDALGKVDTKGGSASIGIVRCRVATSLPYRIDMVERHPLGSQAFIPLSNARMIVVVAEPGESVEASDLRAFVTNGRQGINYHRGTWHMPLIAFEEGQRFLVVDRATDAPNCDEHTLGETVMLVDGDKR